MKLEFSRFYTALSLPLVATAANIIVPRQGDLQLASTNPTALPLASITQGAATQTPGALASKLKPTPGAIPPITGAPAIPAFEFSSANFPALDAIPPLDSPQVKQWIQEVQSSGINIPTFAPTVGTAGCGENPAAAADQSRCWWTCGKCTRETDITTCPDKLTWGLSFDDGPSEYTPDLLNYLDSQQIKSTFFVVGSRAVSRPETLQAEHLAGHQISVHTWSHPSLTTLTNEEIIAELGWTREAVKAITGLSPNTMRPPYGDIDDRVRAIAMAMGMTPIIWTSAGEDSFDTNDWHIASGVSAVSVLQTFDKILDLAPTLNTGFIVLAHDLYQETVELATGYVLPDALARRNPQFNLQPIITCQHKPLGDAYVETAGKSTNPAPANPVVSASSATGTGTSTGTVASVTRLAASTSTGTKSSGNSTTSGTSSNGALNTHQSFAEGMHYALGVAVLAICSSFVL